MNSKEKEVMDILQEECAEVIQAVSKISRFGLDNLKPGKPKTNRDHLEEELGDLYAMIEILQELDVVSWTNIEKAAEAKREKLKQWSNIFSDYNMEPKKGPYPLLSQRITGIWLNRRDYITAELQLRRPALHPPTQASRACVRGPSGIPPPRRFPE